MMKSSIKIYVILFLFASLAFMTTHSILAMEPMEQNDKLKIIRLEVEGPKQVRNMFKNLLTDKRFGFQLVTDVNAPILYVQAEKISTRNKVTIKILKIEMQMPHQEILYSSPVLTQYDFGQEDFATNSVIGALWQMLYDDPNFTNSLARIPAVKSYNIELCDPFLSKKLEEKIITYSNDETVRLQLSDLHKKIDLLSGKQKRIVETMLPDFIEEIKKQGAVNKELAMLTEVTMDQLVNNRIQTIINASTPYSCPVKCPRLKGEASSAVGAVIIMVPVNDGKLYYRNYKICAPNWTIIKGKGNNNQIAPKAYASMESLKQGKAKKWLASKKRHIIINALDYSPKLRVVRVSFADADKLCCIISHGEAGGKDGVIALIPINKDKRNNDPVK